MLHGRAGPGGALEEVVWGRSGEFEKKGSKGTGEERLRTLRTRGKGAGVAEHEGRFAGGDWEGTHGTREQGMG